MQEKQSNLLKFAIKLAKESGQILLRAQKTAKIKKYKKQGDYALDSDYKSEQHIMKKITEKYPEHDILTEETGHHHKDSEYLWIIDPLEGTLNYARHLPIWAVNIGLFHKGQPHTGVIYSPTTNELFYAQKGKGAYLNGKKIHVNKDTNLLKSFFAGPSHHIAQIPLSNKLIRNIGCAGIELAYVACGRFTARIKLHGNDPYGYGAGSIIILEAGGKITDSEGKPWNLRSDGAIASNGKIHNKILNLNGNTS